MLNYSEVAHGGVTLYGKQGNIEIIKEKEIASIHVSREKTCATV